ncbi:2'-5' RNA ligase family protein [Micromonospora sp. NPDC049559]|uniref:2'-5' RNA ligase family protein n=1 Tax=Micromonospora sp. NPDC049559 TaxID=3155923 RepID=UPI00342DD126
MRLFVAIHPSPEALDDLTAQVDRMRIGELAAAGVNVRLAARETCHVTLAFLGEVEEERLPDVEAALGRAAATWRRPPRRPRRADARRPGRPGAAEAPGDPFGPGTVVGPEVVGDGVGGATPEPEPPRLRLGGGGRFGRDRFTVLWVGLQGDVDALRALHGAVRRELRRARLPYDRRPYRPHLTLARPGDRLPREAVDADRDTLDGYLGPSWPVTEVVLMRSHLGPRPLYHRLAAWPV